MTKKRIKLLWITNMMPGYAGEILGIKASNKEGWIEGFAAKIRENNNIELRIAFPVNEDGLINQNNRDLYPFIENTNHPEIYDNKLEISLSKILENYSPDVIHIFGTEFPHCLAALKLEKWRDRCIIHIQGIIEECGKSYTAELPKNVINRVTFRDFIKRDSIKNQIKKYRKRALNEREALILAKNVCGRTEFDKNYIKSVNPDCRYFKTNETLRKVFYNNIWDINKCNRHEIFASQGNYPLKGIHILIKAVGLLKEKYPDIKLYVAGDKITSYESLKDRIKISSYGKYLRELVKTNGIENNVIFTGSLIADEMIKRYKSAEIFVLSSFVENSPNSLGEAMLMAMPTISSNVGGVPSLADDRRESLFYNPFDYLELSKLIEELFENDALKLKLGNAARSRARLTHDPEKNNSMLLNIYREISQYE